MYPILRILEEEGYIESSEEPRGARQRKVYRITEKGVEQLLRMINRGLYVVEATIRLHMAAARCLAQCPRGDLLPLVKVIAGRLARIEKLTDELLETLQRIIAAQGHTAAPAATSPGNTIRG